MASTKTGHTDFYMLKCLKDLFCRKKIPFIPSAKDRLREFFLFCENLEKHPFVEQHGKGGTLTGTANFPETGDDSASLNFDEVHLESLLTRIRQFVSGGELFYFKDLRRAVITEFGESRDFEKFYSQFVQAMNRRFKSGQIKVFGTNGKDVIDGRTYKELMEDRLYTGAIHSERRLNAEPGSAQEGFVNAHVAVASHLTLTLASASISVIQNIFSFRRWILRVADTTGKTGLFPELSEFKKRVEQVNTGTAKV